MISVRRAAIQGFRQLRRRYHETPGGLPHPKVKHSEDELDRVAQAVKKAWLPSYIKAEGEQTLAKCAKRMCAVEENNVESVVGNISKILNNIYSSDKKR